VGLGHSPLEHHRRHHRLVEGEGDGPLTQASEIVDLGPQGVRRQIRAGERLAAVTHDASDVLHLVEVRALLPSEAREQRRGLPIVGETVAELGVDLLHHRLELLEGADQGVKLGHRILPAAV
jgi:hypothetical protein